MVDFDLDEGDAGIQYAEIQYVQVCQVRVRKSSAWEQSSEEGKMIHKSRKNVQVSKCVQKMKILMTRKFAHTNLEAKQTLNLEIHYWFFNDRQRYK